MLLSPPHIIPNISVTGTDKHFQANNITCVKCHQMLPYLYSAVYNMRVGEWFPRKSYMVRVYVRIFGKSATAAARLAQLVERRPAEWEVVSSNLGRTNTQGLKTTEENVLPLS